MLYFSVNSRLKMRQLVWLLLVVLSFFFSVKIGYTGNIDQLCRSVPLLIGQLETKTNYRNEKIDGVDEWFYDLLLHSNCLRRITFKVVLVSLLVAIFKMFCILLCIK